MKRLFSLLLLLFFLGIAPQSVFACSFGEPPTIQEHFGNGGIAVIGEVIETDYLGQNFIVRVENYVAGGAGAEYILVMRNRAAVVEGVLGDQLSGDACNYIEPEVKVGERGLLLLRRSVYGYYHGDSSLSNYQVFIPDNSNTHVAFYNHCEDCESGREQNELTFEDFLALLQAISGDSPAPPLLDNFMSTKQQLVITTDTGTDYLLPVDGVPAPIELNLLNLNIWMSSTFSSTMRNYVDGSFSNLVLTEGGTCTEFDCIYLSDDGAQFAFTHSYGTLSLPYGYHLPGERASFSPDGRFVAVWDDNTMTVYELLYRHFVQELYGNYDESRQINALLSVELDDATVDADVVWSKNGRFLAYSDMNGLWLQDMWISSSETRLVLPPNSEGQLPFAQYFSPISEYLTVIQGEQKQTIDLLSGATMYGGIVSPSGTMLLAQIDYPIGVISVADAIAEGGSVSSFEEFDAVWLDDTHFAWLSNAAGGCIYFSERADAVMITNWDFEDQDIIPCTASLLTSDYYVIAQEATIMINDHVIDLTGMIDGNIVAMQWLPSLMYSGESSQ